MLQPASAGRDLYSLSNNGLAFKPHYDPTGYTPVDPRLDPGENTLIIVGVGQSKIANHCESSHSPGSTVHNLSIADGGVYAAKDPLLGCTGPISNYGSGGVYDAISNYLNRLADKIIAAEHYDRVILAPIAVAGSRIAAWAAGGACNHRSTAICARLAQRSYIGNADIVILQDQGEADDLDGTAAAAYTASCQSAVQTFRENGVDAPYFVALTSWDGTATNATIRTGQTNAVDGPLNILAGPDLDTLGNTERYDNVHFDADGADDAADLWLAVLEAYWGG